MRKHSSILAATKVTILVAMMTIGLSFLSCDNGTTRGATLSGTYINVTFNTRYITFWPDGRYERVNSHWDSEEGIYTVSGNRIRTEDTDGWIEYWDILSENTIRDQGGDYLWRK